MYWEFDLEGVFIIDYLFFYFYFGCYRLEVQI